MHKIFGRAFAAMALAAAVTLSTAAGAAPGNPFALVIGKWSGNGVMAMSDGSRERIACTAEHTGNAAQLNLVIRCKSGERDIRMTARLSANNDRLMGFWEEKYFLAAGAITGTVDDNKLNFSVSGNVNGEMTVTFSRTRQQVLISARDVPLKSLSIDMRRR